VRQETSGYVGGRDTRVVLYSPNGSVGQVNAEARRNVAPRLAPHDPQMFEDGEPWLL
jgi:hypothetical protein